MRGREQRLKIATFKNIMIFTVRLRASLAAVFLVCAMASSGCGGGTYGGGSDGGPATDAAPCLGCFAGGQCEKGTNTQACGTGGAKCVACASGAACVDGVCSTPSQCSKTCQGCCTSGGRCVPGNADDACGQGGVTCQSCTPGTCNAGVCQAACGPDNCLGCCDQSGNCLLYADQSDSVCGDNGNACAACSSGDVCQLTAVYDSNAGKYVGVGACGPGDCSACTTGCCGMVLGGGVTCESGTNNDSCGSNGETCQVCKSDESCKSGHCIPDPSVSFDLVFVSAVVPATDPSGNSWDPFGGLPDVAVTPRLEKSPEVTGKQIDGTSNTTTPTFPGTAALTETLADFKNGLFFDLVDVDDLNPDDPIGTVPATMAYVPPDAVFASDAGPVTISANGISLTFKFVRTP